MTMLTTVERARTMLRADPADDDILNLLIPAASAAIETHCNRSFGRLEYTETVKPEQREYVLLRNYPIESVVSINGDTSLEDYTIEKDRGMIIKPGWSSTKPVSVVYTAGYILPVDATNDVPATLPADIEYGCILMIQQMQREPGVIAERVGDLSVTYAQDDGKMPVAVRALVGPYRNINL
ncbi:head-tail connector protein [Paenibacillus zanthoxyli]|uniref:head-tail connector protein n=1 Tax=Paenibacillus zanthoxyli TaxID=369399 RepID=UPI00068538A0|nr:head-tail connector protein [Paenibacillus zanthoxyli]